MKSSRSTLGYSARSQSRTRSQWSTDKCFIGSTLMASPMRSAAAAPPAPAVGAQAAPTSGFNFKSVLQELIQRNASDLHLKVGRPPTLRVNGELDPLGRPPLRPEDLKALAEQLMTPRQVKQFAEEKECDFAIGVPGIGRFRVNVYQQRGSLCYAMRAIPYQARTIGERSGERRVGE